MTRLVEPGIVAADWNAGEHKGMVTDSVVVFTVREGNPKGIEGWDDLVKEGVEVITPNPFTSGGARWNVMAGYGASSSRARRRRRPASTSRALPQRHRPGQERARVAGDLRRRQGRRAARVRERGDLRGAAGAAVEYVVPDETILIENPVAATKDASEAGRGFVDFLLTDEAQKVFGEEGYRPVSKAVLDTFDFPTPPSLFTIDDFGGWESVQSEFFDRETGYMAEVQKEVGQPTE